MAQIIDAATGKDKREMPASYFPFNSFTSCGWL